MDALIALLPDFFQTLVGSIVLLALIVWSTVWKLIALYRTASRQHKGWFVVLFFLNTAGILEIIYLARHRDKPTRA
jgi:hypothetical protein